MKRLFLLSLITSIACGAMEEDKAVIVMTVSSPFDQEYQDISRSNNQAAVSRFEDRVKDILSDLGFQRPTSDSTYRREQQVKTSLGRIITTTRWNVDAPYAKLQEEFESKHLTGCYNDGSCRKIEIQIDQ